MSDLCRLCSAPLRGSRRKWLFGGSGTLPALFSHVLGTPVLRSPPGTTSSKSRKSKGRLEDAEFLCGKCCHSLNVYHRYDLVMSRMRELFDQRSARLLTERDKLSFTLRNIHARAWGLPLPEYNAHHSEGRNAYGHRGSYNDLRSPGYYKSRNNSLSPGYLSSGHTSPFHDRSSSFHGSLGSLSSGTNSQFYQQLMDQDRSRWEHESWWEGKPTGCPRCIKGDKCHSCSSWRVSDANYESVCSAPRRKRHHRGDDDSSSGLLRSKSLGSMDDDGSSSKGSLSSLSATSLDSLSYAGEEETGVFWEPRSPLPSSSPSSLYPSNPVVGEVLKSLKEITYSPVKTPIKCKIPIRGQLRSEKVDQQMEAHRGAEEAVVDGIGPDWDAFMEIGAEATRTQVAQSRRIQETLSWLQTQLKASQAEGNSSSHQDQSLERQDLIRDLVKSLKFKEELLEDCLTFMLTLPAASDESGELVPDFVQKLKAREEQMKREEEELAESKRQRDVEIRRLQEEVRAREEDVTRLSKILRENQDTIKALRDILGEKDFNIHQLDVALDSSIRSAASQDALRLAALREKDALIAAVQGALRSSNQDVEALADSLLSQGLDDLGGSFPGQSAPNPMLAQLQEKGRLLSQAHADSQRQSCQHQKDIQDLLNALNECQTLLQEQLRHCKERMKEAAEEQKVLRDALRGREAELRAEKQRHNSDLCQAQSELLQMQDSARERDQVTKKLLLDAHNRDQTIKRLQERLSLSGGMRDTL